jgi:hypothetical protein
VSNLCLILLANPDASFVAGFKAWLELGYCVRKGEHAIWIFAPIVVLPGTVHLAARRARLAGR